MSEHAPRSFRSRSMKWIGAGTAVAVLVVSVAAMALLVVRAREATDANAAAEAPDPKLLRIAELEREVERAQTELAARDRKLDRLTSIVQYSAAYGIPANVSRQIYDAAVAE